MKLYIDPGLIARHPDYRMYTVLATGLDNRGPGEGLEGLLSEAQEKVRARRGDLDLDADPRVLAWREAFRGFQADPEVDKPSLEALLARVLDGHDIPFHNKAVAIANLISLRHALPCGGDDLTRIDGNFGLRFAEGLESFSGIGEEEDQHPEPGEVIYADDQKVLCRRWIWRQGEPSKMTEDSSCVAINVDVLPPATHEEGLAAARELASLLEEHCGASTEIVSIGGDTQSLPLQPAVMSAVTRERLRDDRIRRLIEQWKDLLTDSDDPAEWSIHDLKLRGSVEQIVVEREFLERLASGRPIRIYQGFDPTSPDLHIGHLVSLRVLRWFQLHGHEVIFLIGDATALVGDPSGRSEQRQMLTLEKVAENMAEYKQQAGMVLRFEGGDNPVRQLQNSDWLLSLDLGQMLGLMSEITVQRLLERDMFQVRLKNNEPLGYVETIYPLLQGYDSVAMEVDAELGGRDQLFNMMVGRDLVKSQLEGRTKHVLTTPLLPGFDGRKMSKTYGNTVNLTASPFDLFDGIMRVHDELILTYARLLTNIRWSELASMEASLAGDPVRVKERVAFELIKDLRGEDVARQAQAEFVKVRRQGDMPVEMPVAEVPAAAGSGSIIDYLGAADPPVASSKSELRRLIRQGGVRLGERRIDSETAAITPQELDGQVLRLGKKRFFRLAIRDADAVG